LPSEERNASWTFYYFCLSINNFGNVLTTGQFIIKNNVATSVKVFISFNKNNWGGCMRAQGKIHFSLQKNKQNKLRGLNLQARTIPTERPPLVGEVSANFSG
jgi:hypothetical protein